MFGLRIVWVCVNCPEGSSADSSRKKSLKRRGTPKIKNPTEPNVQYKSLPRDTSKEDGSEAIGLQKVK